MTLKCLFWDDEKSNIGLYKWWIEQAWVGNNTDIEIDVDEYSDISDVVKILEEQPQKYHLFISDLIMETEKETLNQGELLILQARQKNPDISIVALTQGDDEDCDGAIKAGADKVFLKSKLRRSRSAEELKNFGKTLLEVVQKHRKDLFTSPICFVFDKYNVRLNAVINSIGVDNIKALVVDMQSPTPIKENSGQVVLRKRLFKVEAFFLRSGLSGAVVLRLSCYYEVAEGSPEDKRGILLKVSRDVDSLKEELVKRLDATRYFGELFPSFAGYENIASSNGWYGIGAKFLDNANTFLDWVILSSTTPDKITQVMKVLFGDGGLQNLYQNTSRKTALPHKAIWSVMSNSHRARIVMALDELTPIIDKKSMEWFDENLYDKELLEAFLHENSRVDSIGDEQISSMQRYHETLYCRNHGDLHCGNILINQHDQPRLIDPANIKEQPWMADIARFCADLIVAGLDLGTLSYEWDRMAVWVDACMAFIEGIPLDASGFDGKDNACVINALNWIREKLPEIQPNYKSEDLEWQFRLGMAVEFLRAGYRRESLTGPKRTLGLIAACIALRSSCEAFKKTHLDKVSHPC